MSASPELPREIRIPHEIVNDDVVIVARWRFAHGAAVRAQDDSPSPIQQRLAKEGRNAWLTRAYAVQLSGGCPVSKENT